MLKSQQPVDLRADMLITLANARHAARTPAHGERVEPQALEPGGTAPCPAQPSPIGQAVPYLPACGRQIVPLCPEPNGAAAQVLAALLGANTDTDGLKDALARLTAYNRATLDTGTGTDTLLSALASQLCILEALMHRYTLEAIRSTTIDVKAPLQKIAFAAQNAYLRTAVLIASTLDGRKIVSTTGGDGT